MPTYEYRCLDCRKRFEVFMTYAEYGTRAVTCPHCGSSNVQRRIGRVRVARSEESRLEDL
ncbi:FmdB family zinc ribbon protein, partial [Thermanaerothrix sp.]|uniref:FmdB family zinc ribbon protein n=1 Tax=Thermanaerothrix sp. TaxID=2972675 RepID=UPI003C7A8686